MSTRGSGDPWSSSTPGPSWRRRILLWSLTLLAGIVLGGVAMGYLAGDRGPIDLRSEPTPTVTVTTTAAPPAGAYVIPAECLRLVQRSRTVADLLSRAATAAADVDAAELSGIVRAAERENSAMTADDSACRAGVTAPALSGSG